MVYNLLCDIDESKETIRYGRGISIRYSDHAFGKDD